MAGILIGKTAIVTGGGSGIGRSAAKVLARDGAKVIVADRNILAAQETVKQIEASNGLAMDMEINVSSLESIKTCLKNILIKLKSPPQIIVNSAGITRDSYLLRMSEKDYDDVLEVNLKGTFMVVQQFAKAMIDHNVTDGSIINLSSIVAKINSIGQVNYAASKSGVISLTEVASKEFGKFGIRVNAILPGYIQTPMVSVIPDKIKQQAIEKCPMGRYGEPEEIAEVIAFLASPKASYVNGASIEVTGGLK